MRLFTLLVLYLLASSFLTAQPCDGRFAEETFSVQEVKDVVYTTSRTYRNKMDIYLPEGDVSVSRPLLIFAHGGGFNNGNKDTDPTGMYLCRQLAKMGFVTVSIQYRLTEVLNLVDSLKMMTTVFKAVQDARGVVRFFKHDAATTNMYRIDTTNIFMSGNSAGAVLTMHYVALDGRKAMPDYIQHIIDTHGGFDGNLGYPGHTSDIKAAVSMAGGINRLEWLDAQDEPVCLVHGELDPTIPFYFNQVYREPPYDLFQLATIHGSGDIHPYLDNLGVQNVLLSYPTEGHTPWDYNDAIQMEVDTFVRNFLMDQVCRTSVPESVATAKSVTLGVYPVPARDQVVLDTRGMSLTSLWLTDMMGRKIWSSAPAAGKTTVNVAGWPAGIYILQGMDSQGKKVAGKIVVE